MAREISGATFAENGCAENKKPLNQQGFIVFGAGNQVRTGDLLAYQQFNLWLYELVLDAVDGTDDKVVDDLGGRITKCYANIDWLRAVDTD